MRSSPVLRSHVFRMFAGLSAAVAAALMLSAESRSEDPAPAVTVDKDKKAVVVEAVIAPREVLKDGDGKFQIYPIEVFATHTKAAGAQKAHETVINVTAKPSEVHKGLESLGLKPGKPGFVGRAKPAGPEVKMSLEFEKDGKTVRIPAEDAVIQVKAGKPLSAVPGFKWLFTGSQMTMPDPEKDDLAYGADFTKTLIGIFPVTNEVVIQSNQEEGAGEKLEVNKAVVPPIGTKVKLIIEPAGK